MSLREYQRKRDFKKTAEPAAGKRKAKSGRSFVVQKHAASRLHYDFRLEMGGVLKSWAVPKGFPSEKSERRLAVHVEDHPIAYAEFEGSIPKGQYGGGTVMVWDLGEYEVLGGEPETAFREGKLHLQLTGKKLRGEWTLVRGGRDQDAENWFLIKTGASSKPVSKTAEEHSAITKRTMEQIARQQTAVWESGKARKSAKAAPKEPARKIAASTRATRFKTNKPPKWVEPMKAKLVAEPPIGDHWLYELKWDGYRALALKNGAEVSLISRNEKPLTSSFPEIAEALAKTPAETAVIDGEICALDKEGRPRFQLLQSREMGRERPPIYFYAFDLLELNGRDFKRHSVPERKEALAELLAGADESIRLSESMTGDARELLDRVRELGLEGVIGKRKDSTYEPGKRTGAWVKLKVAAEQEFVIGGYTPPKGSRKHFGALLVGYYEGRELRYAGKVGTGFDEALLKLLHGRFDNIEGAACPFADLPRKRISRYGEPMTAAVMRGCTWLNPELVCQVRFAEWTDEGSLRQPVFLGLREDKDAREVSKEVPAAPVKEK